MILISSKLYWKEFFFFLFHIKYNLINGIVHVTAGKSLVNWIKLVLNYAYWEVIVIFLEKCN